MNVVLLCIARLGDLSSTMMHGAEVSPMIPKPLAQVAAGTITQQNIGEDESNINRDVTSAHRYSDANQWAHAEPATFVSFENVLSPSYLNLPPPSAVFSAVAPVVRPIHFSQFYNRNFASCLPASATPTPVV